jgi:hypothetical protein
MGVTDTRRETQPMANLSVKKHLRSFAFIGSVLSLAVLAGCESDEGPSARERQDAAMRDPFNYNPDEDLMKTPAKDEVDPTDISGGGTGNLDKKALKRDWDSVFNP